MNDQKMIVGGLIALVAVGGILFVLSGSPSSPTVTNNTASSTEATASGPNVALAACLKDKGVVFYGAFWCPHCKAQKALFGDAVPALPYVECSTLDGNSQTKVCIDKGIKSYPTWRFPDGTELTGEQQLETLAQKASCTDALPGASASTSQPSISVTPGVKTTITTGAATGVSGTAGN